MSRAALERLAAACLLGSFAGPEPPPWLLRWIDGGLGGVCLFGSNLPPGREVGELTRALRDARPDVLVATDEEGGDVTRLWASVGSPIPGNAALGAADDPALTRAVAAGLGAELAAVGIDIDLAPVADVNADAANPVIGVRSFGDDAEVVARHVGAFIEGLQESGVVSCAKHFPGHGATRTDSHLELPVVDAALELLERRELVPFVAAVKAGAAAVMTAHLVVPAVDDRPATVSPRLLVDLLGEELGFTGAVVTDALDMAGIGGGARIPLTVVRALAAGADLCCLGPDATDELIDACVGALVDATLRGDLSEERLSGAAARVAGLHRLRPGPGAAVLERGRLAQLGLEAARRALRVFGDATLPAPGARVVELDRPAMIAAGHVPWGLGEVMAGLDASVSFERLAADGPEVGAALRRADERPLVIAFRDAHRDAVAGQQLDLLARARPDALLVDFGWPHPSPPPTRGRIVTFGSAPPCARAAAQHLGGHRG